MTTRGFGVADVTALAGWICDILDDIENPAVIDAVRGKVAVSIAATLATPMAANAVPQSSRFIQSYMTAPMT